MCVCPLLRFCYFSKPYAHLMKLKQNGHNGIINKNNKKKGNKRGAVGMENTWKSKSKSKKRKIHLNYGQCLFFGVYCLHRINLTFVVFDRTCVTVHGNGAEFFSSFPSFSFTYFILLPLHSAQDPQISM